MGKMGAYCKAYTVKEFRQFDGWNDHAHNQIKAKSQADGKEIETERPLVDDDILFLQENYVVTDGIFLDERVIYDKVDSEWMEFCKGVLRFEIPVYESIGT